MKVWIAFPDENCDWIQPTPKWDFEYMRSFDGRSKATGWKKAKMDLLAKGSKSARSDFSIISGMTSYAISSRAHNALAVPLESSAEFLPLEFKDTEIYLMNVLDVADCLNITKCECKYFDGTQKIASITSYSFISDKLMGHIVFRIKELPRQNIFVTDDFIRLYDSANLCGLSFELVWNSDDEDSVVSAGQLVIEDELPQRSFFPYVEELVSAAAEEVHEASAAATRHLGVGRMAKPADASKAIEERVRSLIDSTEDAPQVERNELDESIELGALFGDILCGQYGWKWKKVGYGQEDSAYAVCSPRDYYCVLPFQFIQKILSGENIGPDGTNDNTVMLLFNMLASIEESVPEKLLTPLG